MLAMVRRSVSTRRWRAALALMLVPTGLASQQRAPVVDPDLQARHNAFLAAIQAHDPAAFTGFFSRTRPWRHRMRVVSPDTSEVVVNTVTFAQLQASLQQRKGDHYDAFFAPGDGLCGTVKQAVRSRAPWSATAPGRFVLGEEPDPESPIYIVWRQEEGRWVIDEISEIVHWPK